MQIRTRTEITLIITLVLLALSCFAIVWQANIIQQQKFLIRRLSGMTFEDGGGASEQRHSSDDSATDTRMRHRTGKK